MPQAALRTPRLSLVPLADHHVGLVIALDSDPEVTRYIENGRPLQISEAEASHRQRLAAADRVRGLGYWAGFLDQDFVGWWSLSPVERPDGGVIESEAELGYRLLPCYWRRGLAKEGATEVLRHGFRDLGLARIWGQTMSVNAASRATMAAVGLRYVRTFHVHFDEPIPGTEEGEVEYAVTREEWAAKNAA